jgi:hypothetical protein
MSGLQKDFYFEYIIKGRVEKLECASKEQSRMRVEAWHYYSWMMEQFTAWLLSISSA